MLEGGARPAAHHAAPAAGGGRRDCASPPAGLGIAWPDGASAGRVIATLDPADPRGAALVDHAAELMRGAGYTAVRRLAAGRPAPRRRRRALRPRDRAAAAPGRPLRDRGLSEPRRRPRGARPGRGTALPRLPDGDGRRPTGAPRPPSAAPSTSPRRSLLADRVGEEFDGRRHRRRRAASATASAKAAAPRGSRAGTIALDDPPVRARCTGPLPLGERVRVRLVKADPKRPARSSFELVTPRPSGEGRDGPLQG